MCARDALEHLCVTQPAITCCIQDVYAFNLTAFHHLQKSRRGTIYHLNLSFRSSLKGRIWRLLWAFLLLSNLAQSSPLPCFCRMLLLLWWLTLVSLCLYCCSVFSSFIINTTKVRIILTHTTDRNLSSGVRTQTVPHFVLLETSRCS